MRISDWSSDVCSSDLAASMVVEPYVSKIIDSEEARPASSIDLGALETHAEALPSRSIVLETMESLDLSDDTEFAMEATPRAKLKEKQVRISHLGRAPCRARVCQYV